MNKNELDIIIIGAGASGLMAARELLKHGKTILLLEARDRIGGRIETINKADFSIRIEAGGEFIHGDLPLTNSLLNEAGISKTEFSGNYYQIKKKKLLKNENFISDLPLLISKLNNLKDDMPLNKFFDTYLKLDSHKNLRESVRRFAEGYDAADITRLSTLNLKNELLNMENSEQYILENGYGEITNYLREKITDGDGVIKLSTVVKKIQWQKGKVEIFTDKDREFYSKKVLITVPVEVLRSSGLKGYIKFTPALPEIISAFMLFDYGGVIKLFFEFKHKFWTNKKFKNQEIYQMPRLAFIFSDAPIGVWWKNPSGKAPVLTGWLAGPTAKKLSQMSDDNILKIGIESLSYIFNASKSFIKEEIKQRMIINWINDPFSLGAYSYATVESKKARDRINNPVENTIFFAGEALDKDETIGTVEAALSSGLSTALRILNA